MGTVKARASPFEEKWRFSLLLGQSTTLVLLKWLIIVLVLGKLTKISQICPLSREVTLITLLMIVLIRIQQIEIVVLSVERNVSEK